MNLRDGVSPKKQHNKSWGQFKSTGNSLLVHKVVGGSKIRQPYIFSHLKIGRKAVGYSPTAKINFLGKDW